MFDLNFSDELTLPYGQRTSVVIDGVAREITPNHSEKLEASPLLINYGFIKNSNDNFELRYRSVSLKNADRELAISQIASDVEATSSTMPNVCTKSKKGKGDKGNTEVLHTYTVKSFPQYGAYGYINYNNGEESDFVYNINLNKSYSGGGFFET